MQAFIFTAADTSTFNSQQAEPARKPHMDLRVKTTISACDKVFVRRKGETKEFHKTNFPTIAHVGKGKDMVNNIAFTLCR